MPLSKRAFVLGGAALAATVGAASFVVLPTETGAQQLLSPIEAMEAALAGDILLIDIRRPDEWERTGVGAGAVPIDMRREDFIDAVLAHRQGSQPIALICARGVRSARMTSRLADAGVTPILDVPEGMLGSLAGSGWIKRGLPTEPWQDS